jgi:hypothetical protein
MSRDNESCEDVMIKGSGITNERKLPLPFLLSKLEMISSGSSH